MSSVAPDETMTQRRNFPVEQRPYEDAPDNALMYQIDPVQRDTDTQDAPAQGPSMDAIREDNTLFNHHNAVMTAVRAFGRGEAHSYMVDRIGDWGIQQIERRDNMMEEGELPYLPQMRTYFNYHHMGDRPFRYWENEDNDITDYHPFHTPALDMIRDGTQMIDDSVEEFRQVLQTNGIPEEALDEFDQDRGGASYEHQDEVSQGNTDYLYWHRETDRRPTEHPDTNFMMNELYDQDRIDITDEHDFDNPTPEGFTPTEDEEGLHTTLFDPNETIEGFMTDRMRMMEYGAMLEDIHAEMMEAREEVLRAFGINVAQEENEPLVVEPQVEDEENVNPDISIIDMGASRITEEELLEQGSSRPDLIVLPRSRMGRPPKYAGTKRMTRITKS